MGPQETASKLTSRPSRTLNRSPSSAGPFPTLVGPEVGCAVGDLGRHLTEEDLGHLGVYGTCRQAERSPFAPLCGRHYLEHLIGSGQFVL